jgi:outer membrane protein assembly factor BamB
MRRFLLSLSGLLISLFILGQNSIQWRGEKRDGIYNETGLQKKWPESGPKLLWHFDGLGDGHASASVTEKVIYTAGMTDSTGYIFAFDLEGTLLWKTSYGLEWNLNWPGSRSTPVVNNGKIYMMSGYGKISCMDASSGKINWSVDLMKEYGGRNITWAYTENLLIDGNQLFCMPGGPEANVISLDKSSGKLIWKSRGNGEKSAYGSPVLIQLPELKILVVMSEKSILGIDVSNGNLLWSHEQTNEWAVHPNTPIFDHGMIYCLSGYGRGGIMLELANDGKSIRELWRNTTLDSRMGGVVILNGKIFGAGDKTRKLQCLDEKTGTQIYAVANFAPGNIISAEGLLYVYSENGQVSLLEPSTDQFNVNGSFKVPYGTSQHWAHLVISNKRLYVRHGSSLMVYDISAN